MRVHRLSVSGYRGVDDVVLYPRDHVLLIGEPGAGRSDLVAALIRVLDPNSTRGQVEVWDFHGCDTTRTITIEVVLAALSADHQQRFARHLEVWDHTAGELLEEFDDAEELTEDEHEWVLRIAYTARWSEVEAQGEHWVYYVKTSDPATDQWDRVMRPERQALPFLAPPTTRPLQIRAEGQFRALLEQSDPTGTLAEAFAQLAADVESLTSRLSAHPAVVAGLGLVLDPLRPPLDVDAAPEEVIRFAPEGGSVAGLLRALAATVDLHDSAGFLPLRRHGSTLTAMLTGAETVALADSPAAVVAIDDFGDELDAGTAEYLAARLRASAGQLWLSTRRPEACRGFAAGEIVRLTRDGVARRANSLVMPRSQPERLELRQLHLQLLPAMTARTVLLCEGPFDALSLNALADRRLRSNGAPGPAAYRARLVEAGGIEQIPKLARLAKALGFRVIALLDHDKPGPVAEANLADAAAEADAVVQLPARFAIERALVHDVDPTALRTVMKTLKDGLALPWPDSAGMGDADIADFLAGNLKARNGLHTFYLDMLPQAVEPPVAGRLLDEAVDLARSDVCETRQMSV
jgi:putative ATP-dependent endonuclease of the OLD family